MRHQQWQMMTEGSFLSSSSSSGFRMCNKDSPLLLPSLSRYMHESFKTDGAAVPVVVSRSLNFADFLKKCFLLLEGNEISLLLLSSLDLLVCVYVHILEL
jgi:hypothetical protein